MHLTPIPDEISLPVAGPILRAGLTGLRSYFELRSFRLVTEYSLQSTPESESLAWRMGRHPRSRRRTRSSRCTGN